MVSPIRYSICQTWMDSFLCGFSSSKVIAKWKKFTCNIVYLHALREFPILVSVDSSCCKPIATRTCSLLKETTFRHRADKWASTVRHVVGRNATSYKFQGFQCRNDLVHPLLLRISMSRYIPKSILFLIFTVILCGGLYPKSLGEPQLSAASYDHAASSAAAASKNSFHELNLDSVVAATPPLERPPQKLCHFFDC